MKASVWDVGDSDPKMSEANLFQLLAKEPKKKNKESYR
jgi:hypothetical protein